jgi:hypothetical protein
MKYTIFTLIFVAGALFGSLGNQPKQTTWNELIQVMPIEVKRAIAMDYCTANRGLCKNLPLSSPIAPMDGK